jgi:peptidoglycan L-alanyl-D-glutamate endopeptidase CwlK
MAVHKLSKSSKAHLEGVESIVDQIVKRVIKKSEHDFGIPQDGGKRTPQRQNNLFHKRPRVTHLDGFKKKSFHQTGWAWDIFIYDEHGACWDCKFKYEEVADLFKLEFDLMKEEGIIPDSYTLSWGGDWTKFRDLPHFEIHTI